MRFSETRPTKRELALLFGLPLFLLMLNLGSAPLFDVDEGAFAEATREMFERHDFLSTWLNGEPRFDKPILIYWLQAIPFWLFGASEWSFRLPSVVAAGLWCGVIGRFAWPRFDREAAMLTSVAAATSVGVFIIGRAATADALLNLCLALIMTDAWRHLESGKKAPLRRMYLWVALGVLTKGPIALMLPAVVTFLFCITRRDMGTWIKAVFDPIGWLILLGVAGPWYAAALATHGQAFIDGFILKHNVGRFTGPMEGHAGSLFYYFLIIPFLVLPWTMPLLRTLREAGSDAHDPLRRYLWIWALFVLGFFSFSGTKLPHYALYGCTPLFLLIAVHRERLRAAWAHFLPPVLALAFFVALPDIVTHLLARHEIDEPYYAAQLARVGEVLDLPYRIATIAALIAGLMIAGWKSMPIWKRLAWIAMMQTVLLACIVTPFVGELLQGPVKRAAQFAVQRGEPAIQWNFFQPSFAVYQNHVSPVVTPRPGQLALTRADRLPPGVRVETLFAEGGVRLVKVLP